MEPNGSPAVGHVHLKVRALERAIEFYKAVLELRVTDRSGQYAFLSWGTQHHDVALQAVGADAEGPAADAVGLYHVAFEVDTAGALRATYERLIEHDIPVSPVDHGISKALYFDDPDGNGVEVYLDTRTTDDQQWDGVTLPFDPTDL